MPPKRTKHTRRGERRKGAEMAPGNEFSFFPHRGRFNGPKPEEVESRNIAGPAYRERRKGERRKKN